MSTEVLQSESEVAYQAILEGVQQGRFAPGGRLVPAQLAAELEMSVVPVREAVRRLQQDGLVAYQRNSGAAVVGIDSVEYRHTMETLALVEGYSSAQCTPLVTGAELQRAREINDQMRRVLDELDPVKFTTLNKQFHSTLYERHQNAHILELVHRGWNRPAALRSSTFAYVPGRARASVDEHDHLLGRIAEGAPFEAVEAAARQHRINTLDAYLVSQTTPQDAARRKDIS